MWLRGALQERAPGILGTQPRPSRLPQEHQNGPQVSRGGWRSQEGGCPISGGWRASERPPGASKEGDPAQLPTSDPHQAAVSGEGRGGRPPENPASRRVGPKQLGCWLCRLAPETLDPHTLRLVWRQRELEIQALRSLQSQWEARRARILREVARSPLER